ncbi:MAG: DUF4296 domain-containing protein [Flavobacteriaceae bacterium]
MRYIFFFFLLAACNSSTIYEKPENLIPEDQMAELIADLEIARYAKGKKNLNKDNKLDYTFLVYEKYGIDSAQYAESNLYYVSKIDLYLKIHNHAKSILSNKKDFYDSIKSSQDSIARNRLKEKSLKKPIPKDRN